MEYSTKDGQQELEGSFVLALSGEPRIGSKLSRFCQPTWIWKRQRERVEPCCDAGRSKGR